jgi:hypothetical protein
VDTQHTSRHQQATRLGALAWLLSVGLPLAPAVSRAQTGAGLDLAWHGYGAGSAATSRGGGLELTAVAGQPAVAAAGGGSLDLAGGYAVIYGVFERRLPLAQGWNLVSIPVHALRADAVARLAQVCSGTVWRWTGTEYVPADAMAPMTGYWVYCAAPAELTIEGTAVRVPVRRLSTGWSLAGPVGLPPFPGLALPPAVAPEGALSGPSWWWDAGLQRYLPEAEQWRCDRGYWVYASVPCDLVTGE